MQLFRKYKNRVDKRRKMNPVTIVALLLTVLVLSLTIGFSAMHSSLDIGSLSAIVRINKDIRVTNVTLDSTTSSAVSNWEEYNVTSISSNVDLPNANSTISFEVEVTNLGNIEMGIFDISGLPNNLDYSISGYNLKNMLCDDSDSSTCKLGSVSTFTITLSYKNGMYNSSSTNYNVKLDFDFRRFYTISYVNLNYANLPTTAIEGSDISFTLNIPYPDRVHFDGTSTGSYNSSTGAVSITNIIDDITISYLTMSYFAAYDGSSGEIFNEFTSPTITSFSRNTSLTSSQIQAMVNNNTAYVISTPSNDANYPSNYEVYGWVDNNHFYWWSEANVVYFHPNTLGAFRLMTELTSVDLNGTNTSLVRNFSHWFDKDSKLRTISGRINTSGLVLEYNNSFNYGNDRDENASGGTGLAFMFNDCKALTGIDLTEVDTSNAGDLKRMFGGCNNITSLDVSHFDTSKAKSMYWMFRKMEKLTELDIRNFDTSLVENMTGMFVNTNAMTKLYLGANFNTSRVKRFNYMFSSMVNLKTIYAYSDFQTNSMTDSNSMFSNTTKVIGSANTIDATPYDSNYTNYTYARLAQNNVKGYFTPYHNSNAYTITYVLDGGTHENPTTYYEDTRTFTLENPRKIGYTFIGWTGSNGEIPELTVTIPTGSTGDRTYIANYEENVVDVFPKVFSIEGSCNFNGSLNNITGATCVNDLDGTVYTNSTYIDTGIQLYNSENLFKDFEIYFEISNYNPSNQETMANGNKQNTIMNTKAESSGYPGIVVRKSNNNIELKSFDKSVNTLYTNVSSYKIVRINKKIYYSINGGDLTLLNDNSTFNSPFNLSVWFGASKDGSGNVFRHSKCTLSNIYIKLGTYS